MVTLIIELAMMVSLAAMLYILISILPRIDDSKIQEVTAKISFHSLVGYLERADEFILSFLEKGLRRARVVILKLDNVVTKKLGEFKKKEGKENGANDTPFHTNGTNGNGEVHKDNGTFKKLVE